MNRIVRFALKPASERQATIRFFARKTLARLPFAPFQVHLRVTPTKELHFWWSYLPTVNHPDRPLQQYWGDDCGELRFLWQFLETGMTFFDVGAYHGIFSLVASLKLAGTGRVVAFEPSPRERRRFELHRRMNRLAPIRLEPYAVGACSGQATFFAVEKGHTSMNSLRPPVINSPVRALAVEKISLDEYLQRHDISTVDVMKIDVEGGELQAFLGARNLLTRVRPVLVAEVLDWVTRQWGYEAHEIVDRLRDVGYEWFDFCDDGTLRPHTARSAYPEIRNYLAVPREKLSLIEGWRSA